MDVATLGILSGVQSKKKGEAINLEWSRLMLEWVWIKRLA
jgi:hypothetical protein